MIQLIHHVPGRLRLKSLAIKNHPQRAAGLECSLGKLSGVASVAANTITGSVVVQYDPNSACAASIRNHLNAEGFEVSSDFRAPAPQAPTLRPSLGRRVLHSVVETIVERSAVALITALI